jgi:undecaprenyl diphosphate synthase
MDGNGRWASLRGLPRTRGHEEGLDAAKRTVKRASELAIPFVTLYTFSTENWQRTEAEVGFLMNLLVRNLKREYQFYKDNRIRVVHSGRLHELPKNVRAEIADVVESTRDFTGTVVNLAVNYGGRDEIIRAFGRFKNATPSSSDGRASALTEEEFHRYLDRPEFPDPDLIVRTGGEYRLSNFLVWQIAYAELYFTDTLWPDFQAEDLDKAVADYRSRARRYGGVT